MLHARRPAEDQSGQHSNEEEGEAHKPQPLAEQLLTDNASGSGKNPSEGRGPC